MAATYTSYLEWIKINYNYFHIEKEYYQRKVFKKKRIMNACFNYKIYFLTKYKYAKNNESNLYR